MSRGFRIVVYCNNFDSGAKYFRDSYESKSLHLRTQFMAKHELTID